MDHFYRNRFVYRFLGAELAIVILGAILFFTVLDGKKILFFTPDFDKYPLLDRYENVYKPFYGVVTDVETHSGISFVTLNNNQKFSINTATKNYECEPHDLSAFIQIGDSIAKPGEDFIFFVYRKHIRYSFKIKEQLRAYPLDTRVEKETNN